MQGTGEGRQQLENVGFFILSRGLENLSANSSFNLAILTTEDVKYL